MCRLIGTNMEWTGKGQYQLMITVVIQENPEMSSDAQNKNCESICYSLVAIHSVKRNC